MATTAARPGLAVIVGEIEADVALPERVDGAASVTGGGASDRPRLEKELVEAETHLAAARARLANAAFTSKAPPAVVAGARSSEAELAEQVARLRARLEG